MDTTLNEGVEEVQMFRTVDGKVHGQRASAERHAERLVSVARGNAMLDDGATVAAALREAGAHVPEGSALERITGSTELTIPHYQCSDRPGYRVRWINADHTLHVWGDAGAWGGPWGCSERWSAVERYAANATNPPE